MRTTNFDTIQMDILKDGSISLRLKDISKEEFDVSLTADEMHMFLVECSNALAEARKRELAKRKKDDLEKEMRR